MFLMILMNELSVKINQKHLEIIINYTHSLLVFGIQIDKLDYTV